MTGRELKVGYVILADHSWYTPYSTDRRDGAAVMNVRQAWNEKAMRPKRAAKEKVTQLLGGSRRFVVTSVESSEGDATVEARQLNEDGSYNPKGRRISFSQGYLSDDPVRKVMVVDKMEMSFVPRRRGQVPNVT